MDEVKVMLLRRAYEPRVKLVARPDVFRQHSSHASNSFSFKRLMMMLPWLGLVALFLFNVRVVRSPDVNLLEESSSGVDTQKNRQQVQPRLFGPADASSKPLAAVHDNELSFHAAIAQLDPLVLRGFDTGVCHIEDHAELYGEAVIVWGSTHSKESAAECCEACSNYVEQGCNVWVWCGEPAGCDGRVYKECWCKRASDLNPLHPSGQRGSHVPWVSGMFYTAEHLAAAETREQEEKREFNAYLQSLKDNAALPMVYFDIAIRQKRVGRITMVLFVKDAPLASENFRVLCTGEKGIVPAGREGAGKPYHVKGTYFYRVVDRFIAQSGVGTESIYGGAFTDDVGGLRLKHERKGQLSMANTGPDSNTSHFSLLMTAAPHLDGKYVVFGQVVDGFEVLDAINDLAKGKPSNTVGVEAGAQIIDSGELHRS